MGTPDVTILSDQKPIGAIWFLGRNGVRVQIEDCMYSGFCVSDALRDYPLSAFSGYSDVGLVWTN